jgi:hypothetical protein
MIPDKDAGSSKGVKTVYLQHTHKQPYKNSNDDVTQGNGDHQRG